MYTISKDFTFSAAHRLTGLPQGHKCSRLHGHGYVVRLVLGRRDISSVGFVRDYGDLTRFKQYIDSEFDHKYLGAGCLYDAELTRVQNGLLTVQSPINPVVDFNPTAENLARYFFTIAQLDFPELIRVDVSETSKTWASFERD